MIKLKKITFFLAVSVFMPEGAYSQGISKRTPPPEAFTACHGKSVNTSCAMLTPRGKMNGVCQKPRGVDKIVCVPAHKSQARKNDNQYSKKPDNTRTLRKHTTTQSSGISQLLPATTNPINQSQFSSRIDGDWRVIQSNGISDHKTGQFPNSGNPNAITEQSFNIRIPVKPERSSSVSKPKIIGWLLNGVPFEPGADEFYLGERSSGWQYEALSGSVRLGLDENHAHVQPSGKYHYHGLPTLFLKRIGVKKGQHSPQIGWAADGFPIFALYGGEGEVRTLKPSYRLKIGNRPTGYNQPGGQYDGTFTQDYEYIPGLGDLDECNGIFTISEDYPKGTYAYFLTDDYPVVPRCLKGKNVFIR